MRLILDINNTQINKFVNMAVKAGFMRAEPSKAWSYNEKREAVKWFINKLIDNEQGG